MKSFAGTIDFDVREYAGLIVLDVVDDDQGCLSTAHNKDEDLCM
ncbi:MAG: hypothetical protein ACRYG8_22535 [Janthinobacterium lividum]